MPVIEAAVLGAGLLAGLAVGLAAHELCHAVVLRACGIPFDVEWRPDGPAFGFASRLLVPLATVTPRGLPTGTSTGGLRLAAMAPLALATPGLLVLAGVVPDPIASGDRFLVGVAAAWFGCALPSPQDFAVFWHPDQVVDGPD